MKKVAKGKRSESGHEKRGAEDSANADALRGILASGESIEIKQRLADAEMHCIRSCNHEWVVFSTALAEVWLMLQCVHHCSAYGSVDDPNSDEWAEAFYAPSDPYLWADKSRVTIRGCFDPKPLIIPINGSGA
jgi:hypothetical protein